MGGYLSQDSTASSKTSPAGTQEPELEEKSAPRRTKRGSQPEHEVPSCTAGTRGPTAGSAEGLPRGVLLQTCKIGSMDPLAVPLDRVLEMTEAQLVQAMLDCPSKAFELPCDGREVRLEVAVSVSGRCNADTVWARLQGPQRVRDVLQIPASTCVAGCFLVIRNGYGVVDEDAVARAPGEPRLKNPQWAARLLAVIDGILPPGSPARRRHDRRGDASAAADPLVPLNQQLLLNGATMSAVLLSKPLAEKLLRDTACIRSSTITSVAAGLVHRKRLRAEHDLPSAESANPPVMVQGGPGTGKSTALDTLAAMSHHSLWTTEHCGDEKLYGPTLVRDILNSSVPVSVACTPARLIADSEDHDDSGAARDFDSSVTCWLGLRILYSFFVRAAAYHGDPTASGNRESLSLDTFGRAAAAVASLRPLPSPPACWLLTVSQGPSVPCCCWWTALVSCKAATRLPMRSWRACWACCWTPSRQHSSTSSALL